MKKIQLGGHIKGSVLRGYALVDTEDYDKLIKYQWYKQGKYAARFRRRGEDSPKGVFMHRVLLNPPKDKQIDHINGNGLDNRRMNLRIVTASQNNHNSRIRKDNTSGYKGIYWDKKKKQMVHSIIYWLF